MCNTLHHQNIPPRRLSLKMPFPARFSQLRNRQSKETSQLADTLSQTTTKSSSSTASLDDDWADISSLDAVSIPSSQLDVASSSTEDSSIQDLKTNLLSTNSRVEEPSDSTPVPQGKGLIQTTPASSSTGTWTTEQKGVYEVQLENLQEQLVDIMIENQTLAQKLQRYENSDVIPLLRKLEEERERNENLSQKCKALEKYVKDKRPSRQVSVDAEEVGVDATGLEHTSSRQGCTGTCSCSAPQPSRLDKIQNYLVDSWFAVMADITDDVDETETDESPEEDDLTVKRLKENLKRFKAACDPIVLFFKAVIALASWKSPSNTFLAFIIYMYVVWRGWSTTVMIGMMIWYLTTTYFISMGWTIDFSLLPYHLVEVTTDEGLPMSMADKFQLVLHVGRKVQNLLRQIADVLERVHNFLYWTNPELTKQLYKNLIMAFVVSLFVSGSTLYTLLGLFIGIRIFVVNPVLQKYPRLKARFSFEQKIFKEVPTNAELEQSRAFEGTEQDITIRLADEGSHDPKPTNKGWRAFSQTFCLPNSEQPMKGWEDGKRCTMISKTTMKGTFKNGRLYLTKSFLCFVKSRLLKDGSMMIPLQDIIRIEKAKPFGFLPGSGMSIEIHLASSEKPVLFGAILNRNLVHGEVVSAWQAAQRAAPRAAQRAAEYEQGEVEAADRGGDTGTAGEAGTKEEALESSCVSVSAADESLQNPASDSE